MPSFSDWSKLQSQKSTGQLVIPTCKQYLMEQWGKSERDIVHVHPSEMAKKDWCERSTFCRIHLNRKIDEKFNFTLQTIFDEGHQIHDKWQSWLKAAGKLWGDWSCMCCERRWHGVSADLPRDCWTTAEGVYRDHIWRYEEVALETGIMTGHEDGAIEDRLIEFKSVGIGTLRHDAPDLLQKFYKKPLKGYDLDGLWSTLKVPLKSHLRQANIYMWMAQEMGGEYARFNRCSIVYEFKPNQQSREFVVPFSEEIVAPLLDRVAIIEYALETGVPPPCPYGGCKQCQAYDREDHPTAPRVRDRFVWRGASGRAEAGTARSRQAGF